MSDEQYWTVDDLAARFKVSKKTIYKWNYQGKGPKFLKIGGLCRWRPRDVLAWENKRIHA